MGHCLRLELHFHVASPSFMFFRALFAFLCVPLPLPPVLCRGLVLLYFGAGQASTTWTVEMSRGYCSYQLYYLSCLLLL